MGILVDMSDYREDFIRLIDSSEIWIGTLTTRLMTVRHKRLTGTVT